MTLIFIFPRHELKVSQAEDNALQPYTTICPTYTDSLYFAAKGIDKTELGFLKFSLVQNKNFLMKDFPYQGQDKIMHIWKSKLKKKKNLISMILDNGDRGGISRVIIIFQLLCMAKSAIHTNQ